MLSNVTPVILTYNEAPNIARTLAGLSWASQIVVVDSFSDDETVELLRGHPTVRLFQRTFDSHANQWNFAIRETGIRTEWILSLDADYIVTSALVEEIRQLQPPPDVAGYCNDFDYCIFGKPLQGSVYPPVTTLFRSGIGQYRQDGHTQRLHLNGIVHKLANRIQHDDRKPLSRWLAAQSKYMDLEAEKLVSAPRSSLSLPDRIRKYVVLAPALVFFYSLFVRGALFDGKAGLYYAFQRTTAEMILSLHLLNRYLKAGRS